MSTDNQAFILGVGMTKFAKPRPKNDYAEMGLEAGVKAMLDANITYDDVERGVASYCYGDTVCGQRVFYQFGMTGIPIYNVNNNCASGSTGIVMARDFVRSGMADCVLVVGFEKMRPGSLGSNFSDRVDPLERILGMMDKNWPTTSNSSFAVKMFGNATREYLKRYPDAKEEDFADVVRIHHDHSMNNPYSQFQTSCTTEEVLKSPHVYETLTKLQCCPTSDGAAAAVIVSKRFLDARPKLRDRAVEIAGQSLRTDNPSMYAGTAISLVGFEMVQKTAQDAYQQASVSAKEVRVAEVHDCFATNMILSIDAVGLVPHGKAHEAVRNGETTYGGKSAVVCPSGGLISKGHPLGATGIAQCAELTWQLRGWANNRLVRVNSGEVALQQNAGIGGASVVTVLRRADGKPNALLTDNEISVITRLGYNPATEARGITDAQIKAVRAKEWSPWVAAARTGSKDAVTAAL